MTEADTFSLGLHEVRELFEKRSNLIRFFKESIGDYINSQGQQKKKMLVAFLYQTCCGINTEGSAICDWVQILPPAFTHYMMGAIQLSFVKYAVMVSLHFPTFCGSCRLSLPCKDLS